MTRILETQIKTQKPRKYRKRYQVQIVTSRFFYEIIYRFNEEERAHMSVSRSTYGNIHETQSEIVSVLENNSAIIEHAKKIVHNIEKVKKSAEPARA